MLIIVPKTSFDKKQMKIQHEKRRNHQHFKKRQAILKDNYGVVIIALFGSYAKGVAHKDSDVDFMVEFTAPSYSLLMGLYLLRA